jgi:hypothetical protein
MENCFHVHPLFIPHDALVVVGSFLASVTGILFALD